MCPPCSPGKVPTPTPAPLMDIILRQDWSATLYVCSVEYYNLVFFAISFLVSMELRTKPLMGVCNRVCKAPVKSPFSFFLSHPASHTLPATGRKQRAASKCVHRVYVRGMHGLRGPMLLPHPHLHLSAMPLSVSHSQSLSHPLTR